METHTDMNDIIIPLAASKIDYLDLRYALRSIEKNLKNYRDIWIIGDLPRWIKNVKNLPHSDDPKQEFKERNIYRKIMSSCIINGISENLWFQNDDHILLEECNATDYPYYYKGSLHDSMLKNNSMYRSTLNHGRKLLERRGFDTKNADTHTPIIYNKKEFLTTFEPEHWLTPYGYPIKSIYCAFNKKEMTFMEDCKITKKYSLKEIQSICEGRSVISCTDAPLKAGLKEYLEIKFPNKSSYEK